MLVNTTSNPLYEKPDRIEPTVELIVFDIGEVSFGIPITKIDRVINSVYLGEDYTLTQNVKILDLHYRLSGQEISTPNAIVIFTSDDGQLYGIPIDTAPMLNSIPLDLIRTLPSEFRITNPLGIASYVAMISTLDAESTIFILE